MGIDTKRVEEVLARAFLAGHGLRVEDAQKAKELAPLLDEVARYVTTTALRRRKSPPLLVDAAAGKAALGVLAAALVDERLAVVALEREPKRRARAEEASRVLGVDTRVRFVDADVGDVDVWPRTPDVVVALHACGAASDAVIDAAVAVEARVILVVPCCYAGGARHEAPSPSSTSSGAALVVPGQGVADRLRASLALPDHGLVGRRFSQAIIDAERTLRLEMNGYETEVVEVFSPSLSPYNFLWRARRVLEPVRMQRARDKHAQLTSSRTRA